MQLLGKLTGLSDLIHVSDGLCWPCAPLPHDVVGKSYCRCLIILALHLLVSTGKNKWHSQTQSQCWRRLHNGIDRGSMVF